jgi:probable HAF family extracellular repeat protein
MPLTGGKGRERRRREMKGKSILVSVIVLLQIYFTPVGFSAEPGFQGLGDLPGGIFQSMAFGVSADGSTAVGWSRTNANPHGEAFRWNAQDGIQSLGFLPGRDYISMASDVSADGSCITGFSGSTLNDLEPFIWTTSGGLQSLGFVTGATSCPARAISNDGSTIVGNTYLPSYGDVAFRWTSSSGIGLLPGINLSYSHYAYGISGDGSAVVGELNGQAYRWTSPGNVQLLGDLPGGDFYSQAFDVSEDGTTVVGTGCVNLIPTGDDSWTTEFEAFLWTQAGGMISLGDLPGGIRYSTANAVSADGSIVVGWGTTDAHPEEAFIWDEINGMRPLQDVLVTDFGLDLSGWTLYQATGISSDGSVIVGYGRNPSGYNEAWIATVPEPATIFLFALGAVILRRKVCC